MNITGADDLLQIDLIVVSRPRGSPVVKKTPELTVCENTPKDFTVGCRPNIIQVFHHLGGSVPRVQGIVFDRIVERAVPILGLGDSQSMGEEALQIGLILPGLS